MASIWWVTFVVNGLIFYKFCLLQGARVQTQQQTFTSNELFNDISTPYNTTMSAQNFPVQPHLQQQQPESPQQPSFPGQQILNDNPMAGIAMQYGSQFVPAGKEFVEKKVDEFVFF